MKRNRVKPTHSWVEVVDVPFTPAVRLPPHPRPVGGPPPPEAPRPLGRMGAALWARVWRSSGYAPQDVDACLLVCEQMDERVALRLRALSGDDWHDRTALRALDQQIASGLAALGTAVQRVPLVWPPETLDWWDSVSTMPHCVLWAESDWQFALDTAIVASAFHAGDVRQAGELRQRERMLGTTVDSRRDLRIRYVEAEAEGDDATVTAMDTYRRMAAGQ